MITIKLNNITKSYKTNTVLKDVSYEFLPGSLI